MPPKSVLSRHTPGVNGSAPVLYQKYTPVTTTHSVAVKKIFLFFYPQYRACLSSFTLGLSHFGHRKGRMSFRPIKICPQHWQVKRRFMFQAGRIKP
jgi:hypothetical protein